MPPKKKRKPRPTQSQKQSQRVTVNIGSTKSAPRKKKSGGGGTRQPSTYSHNLAPTFITAPPVDCIFIPSPLPGADTSNF